MHRLAAAVSLLLASPWLHAQTAPDAGNLLREAERKTSTAKPPEVPPVAAPEAPGSTAGPRVTVQAFKLQGVSLVPEADIQARLAALVGQSAGIAELRRAADTVAALYAERGYLARAFLPEQTLDGGVVAITVLEGRLAALRVEAGSPAPRLSEARVRSRMLARQKLGEPVRADHIQRAVSLLDGLPGVTARALLEPGQAAGESQLVVAVQPEPLLSGQVMLDNGGAKASGEWRVSGGVALNSPASLGDQARLFLSKSRGTDYGLLGYALPLGDDGLQLQLNLSRLNYGYTLDTVRYSGGATSRGALLNYPLVRRTGLNLQLSAQLERQSFDNAVAGVQLSDKTIDRATFGLAGESPDGFGGGGLTQFSLSLSSGRLDLARNAADLAADASGPQRQGHFRKLQWSLSRLQRLTARDTLLASLSGQVASRNLDSAEKLGVAGSQGVRAYASAEPSGDDARLLSLEWRHQWNDQLAFSAFHERAWLRRDHRENSASLPPNRYGIAGSGLGLSWGRADALLVRAAVAWRQGDNPARNPANGADADGSRRNPRLNLALLKNF